LFLQVFANLLTFFNLILDAPRTTKQKPSILLHSNVSGIYVLNEHRRRKKQMKFELVLSGLPVSSMAETAWAAGSGRLGVAGACAGVRRGVAAPACGLRVASASRAAVTSLLRRAMTRQAASCWYSAWDSSCLHTENTWVTMNLLNGMLKGTVSRDRFGF
jgi:hypothetical protein